MKDECECVEDYPEFYQCEYCYLLELQNECSCVEDYINVYCRSCY